MNLLTLSTLVHDNEKVIRFLQSYGVIYQKRLASNSHQMNFSPVSDRWRCNAGGAYLEKVLSEEPNRRRWLFQRRRHSNRSEAKKLLMSQTRAQWASLYWVNHDPIYPSRWSLIQKRGDIWPNFLLTPNFFQVRVQNSETKAKDTNYAGWSFEANWPKCNTLVARLLGHLVANEMAAFFIWFGFQGRLEL